MTASRRAAIVEADRRAVWRPYTAHEAHQERDPLVVARAEGVWLYDEDGQRYLDANSSWWVASLGHKHPRLIAALTEQANRLGHCSLAGVTHEPAARLAEELLAAAPAGFSRVFFSDDGSTAVEVAIKIAAQYWAQNGRASRTRFLSLGGAYHGDTIGAVSLGGVEFFQQKWGPLLFDVIRPTDSDDWERVVDEVESILQTRSDEIAGVFVEPLVQGASGMRFWPADALTRLRAATTRVDTFLIADEVFTGYGRTGTMWACDAEKVSADLMCVAKGFSGGLLPMAATLATPRVYDGFAGGIDRALLHGHSFCGNPLGAAVAREVLRVYREENIVSAFAPRAAQIARGFAELATLPSVRNARALGAVAALELGDAGYQGTLGWRVHQEARARGVYLRPLGDTVYITPPLTISEPELQLLLDVVKESIQVVVAAADHGGA